MENRLDSKNIRGYTQMQASRTLKFTLIELLFVIAIIMILASLLLPALRSAREKSYQISCANNQKQLFLGFSCYSNDYDGYWPSPKDPVSGWAYGWKYKLAPYLNAYGKDNIADSRSVFTCPKTPRDQIYSYGMNYYLANGLGPLPYESFYVKPNALKRPQDRALTADSDGFFIHISLYATASATISVALRHSAGANFLMADGHMQWQKFSMRAPYGTSDSWTFVFTGE